jgi:hypothetical protein
MSKGHQATDFLYTLVKDFRLLICLHCQYVNVQIIQEKLNLLIRNYI